MRRFIFDCDEVLADTRKHIADMLNCGIDPTLPGPFEVEDWIPAFADQARALMATPEFWYTLPPMPMAQEGIQKVRDRNGLITIFSSPYKSCPLWYPARVEWLKEHFDISQNDFVAGQKKAPYAADRFIDDFLENVEDWEKQNPNGVAYLFLRPHNVQTARTHVVTWETIDRIF